ncbi:MAG: hypothetical protein AVDCRST_MAG40-1037, partial [uncultured Gemmatimonadaceae bacterium]
ERVGAAGYLRRLSPHPHACQRRRPPATQPARSGPRHRHAGGRLRDGVRAGAAQQAVRAERDGVRADQALHRGRQAAPPHAARRGGRPRPAHRTAPRRGGGVPRGRAARRAVGLRDGVALHAAGAARGAGDARAPPRPATRARARAPLPAGQHQPTRLHGAARHPGLGHGRCRPPRRRLRLLRDRAPRDAAPPRRHEQLGGARALLRARRGKLPVAGGVGAV